MITVLYFARIREALGIAEECIDYNESLVSVKLLKVMLVRRGGEWASAFADNQRVLVAVNQDMAGDDHAIVDGDEVAFFPPVTGG